MVFIRSVSMLPRPQPPRSTMAGTAQHHGRHSAAAGMRSAAPRQAQRRTMARVAGPGYRRLHRLAWARDPPRTSGPAAARRRRPADHCRDHGRIPGRARRPADRARQHAASRPLVDLGCGLRDRAWRVRARLRAASEAVARPRCRAPAGGARWCRSAWGQPHRGEPPRGRVPRRDRCCSSRDAVR